MVNIYGRKLREVVIKLLLDDGWTREAVATTLGLSRTTVTKYLRIFETHHSFFSPDENRAGRGERGLRLSKKAVRAVWLLLQYHPTLYLDEVIARLKLPPVNVTVSMTTLCRVYSRLGISRHKLRTWAQRRSEAFVNEFRIVCHTFFADQFVFIDETGKSARDLRRIYGRGYRGERPVMRRAAATGESGKRYNAIATLTTDGVPVPYVFEGSVNAEIFLDALRLTVVRIARFLHLSAVPILEPFHAGAKKCVVIMDNASIHHDRRVRELIERVGAKLLYLPPYAPDLNPIEWVFSLIKQHLTRTWAQGSGSLRAAIARALTDVTPAEAQAFIRNAGYTYERAPKPEATAEA
ncbi:unnamed protein product, partial [Phaeothamnion confervicola]